MAKRYVLLGAEAPLTEGDLRELAESLTHHGIRGKVIAVEGADSSVIIKTSAEFVPWLRDEGRRLSPGGKTLRPLLTSGGIGKLKRRASGAREQAHGQVHE